MPEPITSKSEFNIWFPLGWALLLRLLFWQPYYIPGDALSYLNGFDVFAEPALGAIIHIVRMGIVLPLALLQWLGGGVHHINSAYILATSLAMVWMVASLAARWSGPSAGYLAGGVMALAPMEVVYGLVLLPDTPLSFFALAAFWCLATAEAGEVDRRALAAGMLIGVAYTCKVTALFFGPVAALQAFCFNRSLRPVIALSLGFGLVLAAELVILYLLLDTWHVRILETMGFVSGSKGNYMEVEKTVGWWFGQIWFKLGALFWGKHLPTATVLSVVPHLVAVAIWRLSRTAWPQGSIWLLLWGGVWVGQQLLISAIEQEPRYFQAALPYGAIVIGLAFAAVWDRWRPLQRGLTLVAACGFSLVGSFAFWATYSPTGHAYGDLAEQYDALIAVGGAPLVDGPSEYELKLAHYRGLQTTLTRPNGTPTHWAEMENGYGRAKRGSSRAPEGMETTYSASYQSPLRALYRKLDYSPGVGGYCVVYLYNRSEN